MLLNIIRYWDIVVVSVIITVPRLQCLFLINIYKIIVHRPLFTLVVPW